MEIRCSDFIPFPKEVVFRIYRDRLAELADYLPNIRRIDVLSREGSGPEVKIVNIWHATGQIPAVAQRFVKPEMLRWTDRARWDEREWRCYWDLEPHFFTRNVRCSGVNYFEDEAGGMRLTITGRLDVTIKGLKGVPSFLDRAISPQIERFVVSLITPNLRSVNQGLVKFLDDLRQKGEI